MCTRMRNYQSLSAFCWSAHWIKRANLRLSTMHLLSLLLPSVCTLTAASMSFLAMRSVATRHGYTTLYCLLQAKCLSVAVHSISTVYVISWNMWDNFFYIYDRISYIVGSFEKWARVKRNKNICSIEGMNCEPQWSQEYDGSLSGRDEAYSKRNIRTLTLQKMH